MQGQHAEGIGRDVADAAIEAGILVQQGQRPARRMTHRLAVPASVDYVTAELQLSAATVNGGPNALGVYDVTTNVATDTLANIYADLGTGTSYGTATGIASGDTIVVTLNAQGLAAVNAAKGSSITFGLTNTTIEANADNIFAGSNAASSRLVLNTSQPAPVPTLSEWAMILFGTILAGGAALYIQRRRFTA